MYHTTVTVFEPDVTRKGFPFDYLEYLLEKDTNYEIDIKTEDSQTESVYHETLATDSKRESSVNNIISQTDPNVNTQNSLSADEDLLPTRDFQIRGKDVALEEPLPIREDTAIPSSNGNVSGEDVHIVEERLSSKLQGLQSELEKNREFMESSYKTREENIQRIQSEYDSKKDKNSKTANALLRRIERERRLQAEVDAEYKKRIAKLESQISKANEQLQQDHTKANRLEQKLQRIDRRFEREKTELDEEFKTRRQSVEEYFGEDENSFFAKRARELYDELQGLKKGVRASNSLGYLIDHVNKWSDLKTALLNVERSPSEAVNEYSEIESVVRKRLSEEYD